MGATFSFNILTKVYGKSSSVRSNIVDYWLRLKINSHSVRLR